MANLSQRQEAFCQHFAETMGKSACASAIAAGYAPSTAKHAPLWIKFNPGRPEKFRPCVAARVSELFSDRRASNGGMSFDEIQAIRTQMIRGELSDISVSVKGEIIEHPPTLADRRAAMKDWETCRIRQDERDKVNAERESTGITLDVPEEFTV